MLGWMPSEGSSSSSTRGRAAERARDREHLLLAARQRAAGLLQPLAQDREILEDLLGDLGGLLAPGAGARADQQVLAHRQLGEDAATLRHEARRQGGRCGAATGR